MFSLKGQALSREYGKKSAIVKALNNVSCTINKGEIISLTGPSGSGKSTLLHLLGGLDNPTSGNIFYNDKNVTLLNDKEKSVFRRDHFGFIFQNFQLLNTLSAKDNIRMPTLLAGKEPDHEWYLELAETLEISNRLTHLPDELSGGQQQRVAIARALINKPSIIFADEPTGNLDKKTGDEVLKLLLKVVKQFDSSLLLVTHDANISLAMPRQIKIVDGTIVEDINK